MGKFGKGFDRMLHGMINVYKEAGFTSHDVVAKLRGILRQKKIGHTGTLDPDAVGVLPVCLGSATRLCDMLTDRGKEYRARMLLGVVTDTQDLSGKVLEQHEVNLTEEAVREAAAAFIGGYDQIPPMYSALKVNGKRLYELARQGKEVERTARRIEIPALEIEEIHLPEVTMKVCCSKGTYIRTLCHDMGARLGCGGAMAFLERTRVGEFRVEEALPLAEIQRLKESGELAQKILPVDTVFQAYQPVTVADAFRKLIDNGNPFLEHMIRKEGQYQDREVVRVYNEDGRFYGIYEYRGEGRFHPVKMFMEN